MLGISSFPLFQDLSELPGDPLHWGRKRKIRSIRLTVRMKEESSTDLIGSSLLWLPGLRIVSLFFVFFAIVGHSSWYPFVVFGPIVHRLSLRRYLLRFHPLEMPSVPTLIIEIRVIVPSNPAIPCLDVVANVGIGVADYFYAIPLWHFP